MASPESESLPEWSREMRKRCVDAETALGQLIAYAWAQRPTPFLFAAERTYLAAAKEFLRNIRENRSRPQSF